MHEESSDDEEHGPDFSALRECNVLWAVSVPGESEWCSAELSGPSGGASTHLSFSSVVLYSAQKALTLMCRQDHINILLLKPRTLACK